MLSSQHLLDLHFALPQEKEKFKIQLKKCLRISDETHLECLEKAMTEKKSRGGGEGGGKKAKAGGGYGSSEKQTKKRKSVDKASKKVS